MNNARIFNSVLSRFGLSAVVESLIGLGLSPSFGVPQAAETGGAGRPLRIICFGAHPDDCELKAGGVGAMWAAKGHKVKLVSVTNGDIGHWREAGGPLAKRRKAEAARA